MKRGPEYDKLLAKISSAYYKDNLTQQQIAQRFGLSRIKVSRLLSQAREEQIVQITIVSPQEANIELERDLEAQYGLDEAIVISPTNNDLQDQNFSWAVAASCLVRGLRGDEILGLTWGTTLSTIVEALPTQHWPDMRIVQMLGGLGHPATDVYGADLVHRAAQALGAQARMLSSPGIVPTLAVYNALIADPQISDTLALAAKADLALVGIGHPTKPSVVMRSHILTETEFAELQDMGAVGDIGLRFFDAEGHPVDHEINQRIIGLDLAQITNIPRVIGVATGAEKLAVIRAALRGKLVNVLITDKTNAQQLVVKGY